MDEAERAERRMDYLNRTVRDLADVLVQADEAIDRREAASAELERQRDLLHQALAAVLRHAGVIRDEPPSAFLPSPPELLVAAESYCASPRPGDQVRGLEARLQLLMGAACGAVDDIRRNVDSGSESGAVAHAYLCQLERAIGQEHTARRAAELRSGGGA